MAKPSVVSKIVTLTETHGHVLAALLAQMKDLRSACFENCEAEFRYSRCIRQRGVEAAKYVLWKAEEKWKTRGVGDLLSEGNLTTSTYSEECCGQTIAGYSVTTKRS